MSIFANVEARLSRQLGNNFAGEPEFGVGTRVMVGVVHLIRQVAKTSVRTDSSASRGNAEEQKATAKILFLPADKPRLGDRVEILGHFLRVQSLEPRIDTFGKLDHYECLLTLWDDE